MRIYTRTGDDGTTGLLYGGRVAKDSELPCAYGDVDEAQAALGVVRAELDPGRGDGSAELAELVLGLQRDLWVLMAELATAVENHHKLTDGQTRVTPSMVEALERLIDAASERFEPPTEFVVPGGTRVAALLDVARTIVRRAERSAQRAVTAGAAPAASEVVRYLNRLSDLCWTLARWAEGDTTIRTRSLSNPPTLETP